MYNLSSVATCSRCNISPAAVSVCNEKMPSAQKSSAVQKEQYFTCLSPGCSRSSGCSRCTKHQERHKFNQSSSVKATKQTWLIAQPVDRCTPTLHYLWIPCILISAMSLPTKQCTQKNLRQCRKQYRSVVKFTCPGLTKKSFFKLSGKHCSHGDYNQWLGWQIMYTFCAWW